MKTFDQLTDEQKFRAINVAYEELKEACRLKLITSDRVMDESDLYGMAEIAAEGSKYNDEGNPITEEVEVPYYFQGGCV